MTFKSRLKAIVVAICMCLLVPAFPSVSMATGSHLIHPKYLKGVDTIVVGSLFDMGTANFLFHLVDSAELNSWVRDGFSDMFSSMSKIKIGVYGTNISWAKQINSIIVLYDLSVREEMVKGNPVKTAALTVQFLQSFYYASPDDFSPVRTVAYPFLVPETKEELRVKIKDGVRYLTDYLPSMLCHENKPPKDCDDTDAKPYVEKLPSATIPKTASPAKFR